MLLRIVFGKECSRPSFRTQEGPPPLSRLRCEQVLQNSYPAPSPRERSPDDLLSFPSLALARPQSSRFFDHAANAMGRCRSMTVPRYEPSRISSPHCPTPICSTCSAEPAASGRNDDSVHVLWAVVVFRVACDTSPPRPSSPSCAATRASAASSASTRRRVSPGPGTSRDSRRPGLPPVFWSTSNGELINRSHTLSCRRPR